MSRYFLYYITVDTDPSLAVIIFFLAIFGFFYVVTSLFEAIVSFGTVV